MDNEFVKWKFKKYHAPGIIHWLDMNVNQYRWQILVCLLWIAFYTSLLLGNRSETLVAFGFILGIAVFVACIGGLSTTDEGSYDWNEYHRYGPSYHKRRCYSWLLICLVFVIIPIILLIIFGG